MTDATMAPPGNRLRLLYLNVGHFIDHMMMLIFAKAAFDAGRSFGLGENYAYAEMLPYGMPGLILLPSVRLSRRCWRISLVAMR